MTAPDQAGGELTEIAAPTWRTESGNGWAMMHGDCRDVLPAYDDKSVDVVIADPPYGEHVHRNGIRMTPSGQARGHKRRDIRKLPDAAAKPCRVRRSVDLGFEALTPGLRAHVAIECARVARRWVLVFSDTEGAHGWREALEGAGLEFVRYCFWVKDRGMPQISGDRPASWVEQITVAHPKGKKRWNGGGSGNVWRYPVVANCSGHRNDRIHTAQKPIELMQHIVGLFSDEGETVLDPFAGSGTTGVAALRLGRRFVGIEQDAATFELACARLRAEESNTTLHEARAGQEPLFGAGR